MRFHVGLLVRSLRVYREQLDTRSHGIRLHGGGHEGKHYRRGSKMGKGVLAPQSDVNCTGNHHVAVTSHARGQVDESWSAIRATRYRALGMKHILPRQD